MSEGFGSSGSQLNSMKPVELDKQHETDIQDMSRRGDGIAKIDGFIIFVVHTRAVLRVFPNARDLNVMKVHPIVKLLMYARSHALRDAVDVIQA